MIQIKNIKYSIFALSGLLFLASCEGSEDLSPKSVINVSQTPNSEFQTYLNQILKAIQYCGKLPVAEQ